ncbi:hypothetical protein F4782DRAFT_510037 [Xylaria castorea]|nr:hypothetical protein F4782DRAFT_510037 [Xylaria castorea]
MFRISPTLVLAFRELSVTTPQATPHPVFRKALKSTCSMSRSFYAPVPLTRLYFAYGNNLWLEQMAKRCPDSVYVGRAVLPDHCWFINRRGAASIAPRSGSTVHGLVYEITANDETYLDRSERIHNEAYIKTYRRVNLYEVSDAMQMTTRLLVKDGGPEQVIRIARHLSIPTGGRHDTADVLVYLSQGFVINGQACDYFIDQMNRGISDAISLGVPPAYFSHVVREWIPKRLALYNSRDRLNGRSLVNYQAPVLSTTRVIRSRGGRRLAKELRHWNPRHGREYQAPHFIIEVCHY